MFYFQKRTLRSPAAKRRCSRPAPGCSSRVQSKTSPSPPAIFSGKALEAELETTETEVFPGFRANITGIRPIVDATANVVLKTRDKLADTATSSSSSTINSSGIAPVRQSGRYMRANVKIPAESLWTHAQGIDLTASQGGSR